MPTLYDSFKAYKRHVAPEGSFHLTYTHLPLLVEVFGLRDSLPPAIEACSETIGGERVRDVVSERFLAIFMGMVTKEESGDLLDGLKEEGMPLAGVQSMPQEQAMIT